MRRRLGAEYARAYLDQIVHVFVMSLVDMTW